ncbi:hypothetical protein Taro_048917 [Colocasia esculenta]|uniref:EGF-like domain-containing protein n=1 Tax=Colocasia esculenta TaxID=4460 RepID=A0A843X9D7_COLES|nr:hypothetical protein [Colocasia esculenta]
MVPISVLLLMKILVMTTMPAVAEASTTKNTLLPHCQDKCGNITIPYPFGVGEGCFREGFEVRCDYSASPPKPLIDTDSGSVEVVEIFLSGELRIRAWIGRACHDDSGAVNEARTQSIDLTSKPFTFSNTKNKFVAVGCDTVAIVEGIVRTNIRGISLPLRYAGGCVSHCYNSSMHGATNRCDGMGCCEASIPKGLKQFGTSLRTNFNYSDADMWGFSKCGYAFVAEEGRYQFEDGDLTNGAFDARFAIMLDWSVGNLPCYLGIENGTGYACRSRNSECSDAPNPASIKTSLGYVCSCSAGYQGNPYLEHGCKDIDECADPGRYPCNESCTKTPGSYNCSCPPGAASADPKRFPCLPMRISTEPSEAAACRVHLPALNIERRRGILQHKFFRYNGGLFMEDVFKRRQVHDV